MEDFNDYEVDKLITNVASSLGICVENSSIENLFNEIEDKCPDAANIILSQTDQKDSLKNYLKNKKTMTLPSGSIYFEGDPQYDSYWVKIASLYPMLLEAIKQCK